MKRNLLWLDDIRDPLDTVWFNWINFQFGKELNIYWAKNYEQFVNIINNIGIPDFVSFDHDLGDVVDLGDLEKNGTLCAKYLIDKCIDMNVDIPKYAIQSANEVGKQRINSLMSQYHDFFIKTNK